MLDSPKRSNLNTYLVLGGLGGVSLLFYMATNFLIPQLPQHMAYRGASLIHRLPFWSAISRFPIPESNAAQVAVAIVTASTIFTMACYVLALRISRRISIDPISLTIVIGFAIVFTLTTVLTLPNFSGDLYSYTLNARVFNVYGANPYATPPAAFVSDPYLKFGDPSWNQLIVPYGPTWTYLSILWQRLAGGDILQSVLAFRGLLFGFNLANVALIWMILGRLKPAYRLTGIIFYAWNPIVVLKASKHVEPVMVFFLLLSVYLLVTNREWLALVALTLSALTKFVTAPLVIAYLIFLWRRRSLRLAVFGAGLAGGLVLLAFLPVWDGWEMVLRLASDPGTTRTASLFTPRRILFTPGFIAVILWTSLRGRGTSDDLLRGWAIVMLWFSFFLMPTHYAWYLITLIAIVSLIESTELAALTITLSLTALLSNMLGLTAMPYISVPIGLMRFIWWVPPLLVLAWLYRSRLAGILPPIRKYVPELRKSIRF